MLWLRLLRLASVLLEHQMLATMAKLGWDRLKLKKRQEFKIRFDG